MPLGRLGPALADRSPMNDPWLDKLAEILVSYSVAVRPGDVVVISGAVTSEPLVVAIFNQVLQAGGSPLVRLTPEICYDVAVCTSGEDRDRFLNPLQVEEGRLVDCSIGIWSRDPAPERSVGANAVSQIVRPADAWKTTAFFDRAARGALRWVGTEFPTAAAAERAGMTAADYAHFLFRAALLDSPDPAQAWQAVHDRQQRLCETLEKASELRLVTPQGTDLTLGIENRRWANGDGHINLPDGEVFTAPIEDSVRGSIRYSFPVTLSDTRVEGIHLEFRDGRVVNASARTGEVALVQLLDRDSGSRTLGEVALGLNSRVDRATGSELLDEKIGGTCHTALGASYPQTGGRNCSAVHCDLVCDLRQGGRVEVNGQVLRLDGSF